MYCQGIGAECGHVCEPDPAGPCAPINRPDKRRKLAETGAASPVRERKRRSDSQRAMDAHVFAERDLRVASARTDDDIVGTSPGMFSAYLVASHVEQPMHEPELPAQEAA